MSTLDDAELRIRDPFAFVPPQYQTAVARYFYDYDPEEEPVGTSYEHGDVVLHLLLLIHALLKGREYTLYQNTDFDINVPPNVAGNYARRSRARTRIQDAAGDAGTPDPDALIGTRPVAPDVALVLGQLPPEESQPSYRIGRDGPPPQLAIEIASESTADLDITEKLYIYCNILQVNEYFAFDPRKGRRTKGYWTGPQLRGWQRDGGEYIEMQPDARGRIWCEVLQSWLGPDDIPGKRWRLCLWDAAGNRVLTGEEAADERATIERTAKEAARAERQAERVARRAAEARADAERVAKEAERAAREAAEAENARLLAELRRLRGEA